MSPESEDLTKSLRDRAETILPTASGVGFAVAGFLSPETAPFLLAVGAGVFAFVWWLLKRRSSDLKKAHGCMKSLKLEVAERKRRGAWALSKEADKHLAHTISVWREPVPVPIPVDKPTEEHVFDDPVHGKIELLQQTARLLDLPIIQRLARVNQLPFKTFAYPGANHTRLQHSLGAAYLCRVAVERMLMKHGVIGKNGTRLPKPPRDATKRDVDAWFLIAEVVGLLHDVGHGPFAHATDALMQVFAGVEWHSLKPDLFHATDRILNLIPDACLPRDMREDVIEILTCSRLRLSGYKRLIADVVDQFVNVDRLDYLMRDGLATCMPEGRVDVLGIVDAFRAYQTTHEESGEDAFELVVDSRAAPLIGHFIYSRHMMYLRCYDSERKAVCERLLRKVLWRLIKGRFDDLIPGDEARRSAFFDRISTLMLMTDEQLLDYLWATFTGDDYHRSILEAIRFCPNYELVLDRSLRPVSGQSRLLWLMDQPSRDPEQERELLEKLGDVERLVGEELGLPDGEWSDPQKCYT